MEISSVSPWFRGKVSQPSFVGHAIANSNPLGNGSWYRNIYQFLHHFVHAHYVLLTTIWKYYLYWKDYRFCGHWCIRLHDLNWYSTFGKETIWYVKFPDGTNTEYLMLFRSSEFFSFVFFIFQQRIKTERYWKEIFDSNLFALHLWSRKNMSYIKYFIFVYHYWVIVLLWWFYHWFHLSWYWPVWSGSYFLSVVPLYRQLRNWALIMFMLVKNRMEAPCV